MSLPVILRPVADADIQATYDELERVKAGLGDRFVARVRQVLERIEAMPQMYGLVWQDAHGAAEEIPACGLLCGLRGSG
jgi:hypothetical protein